MSLKASVTSMGHCNYGIHMTPSQKSHYGMRKVMGRWESGGFGQMIDLTAAHHFRFHWWLWNSIITEGVRRIPGQKRSSWTNPALTEPVVDVKHGITTKRLTNHRKFVFLKAFALSGSRGGRRQGPGLDGSPVHQKDLLNILGFGTLLKGTLTVLLRCSSTFLY